MLYGTIVSSMFLLLFYEPLSILFETSQVQLYEKSCTTISEGSFLDFNI